MAEQVEDRPSPLPEVEASPEWGIEPVPPQHRSLGFIDFFVLWSSLGVGVGLLVLQAGALLVPGLSSRWALLAAVLAEKSIRSAG